MANTLVAQIWTPGSDYTLGVSDSQIVYTRDGNDSIVTYNPGVDNNWTLDKKNTVSVKITLINNC